MDKSKLNSNNYFAFISYSRKDIKDAKWIHSSLEKFHIPAKLPRPADSEPVPKPLRCFRDINDLDVMPESFVKGIENAIASSKFLVVVCSPNAAQSTADGNHYVDWEIQEFIKIHGLDYAKSHILPVIIGGKISYNQEESECLPPSIYKLGDDFLEHNFPILDYGDENVLTKEAKNDFILKILAFLLQVKYSVLNDRYQKALRRRRHFILGLTLSLAAVFAVISTVAILGWKKADESLALSYYRQAHNLLESNDVSRALAYYNKSLKLDSNPVVQDEVYSLITNSSWLVEKEKITDLQKTSKNNSYEALVTDNGVLQVIDVESKKVLFQDTAKDGYSWYDKKSSVLARLDCVFDADNTIFAYKQEYKNNAIDKPYSFIITILNLSTLETLEVRKDSMLSTWTLSSDGQFLVYSANVANEVCELSVYNITKKQTQWTRRERFPRTSILFSPDNVHFATIGSILFGDPDADEVQITNCFYEDEKVTVSVKGSVEKMKFSHDGRHLAVFSSKNELSVFNTRDGMQLVKPRLFSKNIIDINFTSNDNSLQIKFDGNEKKEYELRENTLNFSTLRTSLYSGVINDTLLLNKDYICNFCGNVDDGLFLEVRNLNNKTDIFLTPLDEKVQESLLGFIRKSPSGNTLFFASGRSTKKDEKGFIEVYSVDFNRAEYLLHKQEVEVPCQITDIRPISDRYAIVYSGETSKQKKVFLLDLNNESYSLKDFDAEKCYAYALNEKNELFTLSENSDGKGLVKKWDVIKQSEKWSVPLDTKVYLGAMAACDTKGNSYFVLNNKKIIAFDKKGNIRYDFEAEKRVTMLNLNKDSSLMILGTNPYISGREVSDIEVRETNDGNVRFKTDYESEKPVSITKAKFSDQSNILHIAGSYRAKKDNAYLGFYDVWDINSSIKFNTDFTMKISKVFNFDLLPDGTSLLYSNGGIINKKSFTRNKNSLAELQGDLLYQKIGGWSLNKYDVPQAFESRIQLNKDGNIVSWLCAPIEKRTLSPEFNRSLLEELEEQNKKSNRELILDIQADNQKALDSYYFDIISSVVEKNFKKGKSINSVADEIHLDNSWNIAFANNFWNMVSKDEEALKVYKFHIENYMAKVHNSPEPLNKLYQYYRRIGHKELAQTFYDKMLEEYADTLYIKLRKLDDGDNLSLEKKKSIFKALLKDESEYSFEELKDMFDYYRSSLALDSSFEEIKASVSWFLKSFKNYLIQDTAKYADGISNIFSDISNMTQLHIGGFDYYLDCIEYMYKDFSNTQKILLRLDKSRLFSQMMNSILKGDSSFIENLINEINFSSLDEAGKIIFMENLFMYYSSIGDSKKDSLLEQLLDIDRQYSFEYTSLGILTDVRIYKKLGKYSVCNESDIQKAVNLAFELMAKRLVNGQSAGLQVYDVIPSGQASKVGLKKGDILLFYDGYPLESQTSDFFRYDLHTGEQKENKADVELIVLQNGKLHSIMVKEGLLGIAF